MDDFYTKKDINKYTFEFEITIPSKNFKQSYDLLLKDYSKDLNVKGFRKGNVPSDLISDQVREVVKFETFEKLAPMYINTAISKEKLEPIAPPEYKEIPKILEDLDVTFTITITTMPKFKLGDLTKIKVKQEKMIVEDKEVDTVIEELKKSQKTKSKEINNAWAKEIGKILGSEDIKTLEDLKAKIKDSLQKQKEHLQLHKMQEDALKLAISESKIEIPKPAIDFEAKERERYFNEDMQQKGISIDDFLSANNITIEKMRELWQQDAKEAIETDVFLTLYADTKKVKVTDKELEKRIENIKKSQPDADQNIFNDLQWREYIKKVEKKEKGFRLFIEEVLGKDFLDSHN